MTLHLHGATATLHDHVARAVGDFDVVRSAIDDGNDLVLETAVVRANVRSLGELARWLLAPRRRSRIASWTLVWPGPQPEGLSVPRLGMAAPRVLHAAHVARQGGLTVSTRGLPPCVLGPHAPHAVRGSTLAFADPCRACSSRARCDGVPSHYLDAFAADLELRALS